MAWETTPVMAVYLNRWLIFASVLAGLGFQTRAEAEDVRVSVVAILATTDGNAKVDARVKDVAEEVQKRDPSLKGFRLARTTCKPLQVGEKDTFPLVEDQVVEVAVKHAPDKDNRVCLTVTPPRLGAITYKTCCKKFFPIVTGYLTKKDERLIIAIMVRPCGEK